jgi:hypothetical protein
MVPRNKKLSKKGSALMTQQLMTLHTNEEDERRVHCVWHWYEDHPGEIPPPNVDTICQEHEDAIIAQSGQRRANRAGMEAQV